MNVHILEKKTKNLTSVIKDFVERETWLNIIMCILRRSHSNVSFVIIFFLEMETSINTYSVPPHCECHTQCVAYNMWRHTVGGMQYAWQMTVSKNLWEDFHEMVIWLIVCIHILEKKQINVTSVTKDFVDRETQLNIIVCILRRSHSNVSFVIKDFFGMKSAHIMKRRNSNVNLVRNDFVEMEISMNMNVHILKRSHSNINFVRHFFL